MREWFYHLALALACQKKGDLFRQLCVRFGSAKGALAASQEDLARITGLLQASKIKDPSILAQAAQEAELIEKIGAEVLPLGDPLYPAPIAAILDPPPVLFAKGKLPLAKRPIIAIVGSRKSDEYGLHQAEKLARQFARRGAIVVSGGAIGIDTAAHKGALTEGGQTIAVLGSGLAETYPKENASLFEEISQRGALLSELTAQTPARPEHFPRRNRLISGIAEAIIIVRGDLKSGASHTAKAAREQGKKIYAVPGRADELLSQLPHRLLKEGALLCESADDVLFSDSAPQLKLLFEEPPLHKFSNDARRVYEVLSSDAESVDVLISKASLPSSKVSAALLELELAGACAVYPGGRYARKTH